MQSIVKLLGVTSCCIVGSITAAKAEPTVLADAELDRVAAGSCSGIPGCVDQPLGGFQRPGLLFSPLSRLRPFPPDAPDPDRRVPIEGDGRCRTGACQPIFSFAPFPSPEPIAPVDFAPFAPVTPFLTPISFGGCGGPAATCAGAG